MTYSFLELFIFFWLTQVDIDCWSLFLITSQKYYIWIQTPKETNPEIKTSIFTCFSHEIKTNTFPCFFNIKLKISLWTIFIFSQFHAHIFRSSCLQCRCSSKQVLLKISQYSKLKIDLNRGAFLRIFWFFNNGFLMEHLRWLLL